ncbi:MAG: sensor histidine kinase, partial [Epsilonproteobacteria bacterium]|nr:sensor histidine kinase [Campylobacterota bacterium]
MKKYEIEALLKNFFIFFFLQLLLLAIIYNKTLSSKIKSIDSNLLDRMKLCSYTLDCKEFRLGFIEKESQPVVTLIKEENELFSLFHIPDSKKYLLKLSLDKAEYLKKIEEVRGAIKKEFLIYALLIAILSFIFSLYSLYPFKKALDLNEKFIKDILHDYNTPISSLLINFKLLKKEIGENRKINRMEQSIN